MILMQCSFAFLFFVFRFHLLAQNDPHAVLSVSLP